MGTKQYERRKISGESLHVPESPHGRFGCIRGDCGETRMGELEKDSGGSLGIVSSLAGWEGGDIRQNQRSDGVVCDCRTASGVAMELRSNFFEL